MKKNYKKNFFNFIHNNFYIYIYLLYNFYYYFIKYIFLINNS